MILASTVLSTFAKYGLYIIDMRLDGRWENKANRFSKPSTPETLRNP
jgi:hypothetical protein